MWKGGEGKGYNCKGGGVSGVPTSIMVDSDSPTYPIFIRQNSQIIRASSIKNGQRHYINILQQKYKSQGDDTY